MTVQATITLTKYTEREAGEILRDVLNIIKPFPREVERIPITVEQIAEPDDSTIGTGK